MIANVLNTGFSEGRALLSGNIGFPASNVAQTASAKDRLIMELSSFQLMGIETLHPKIAVITNIYEAHLDYHGNRSEYVRAKWKSSYISKMRQSCLFLNWAFPAVTMLKMH